MSCECFDSSSPGYRRDDLQIPIVVTVYDTWLMMYYCLFYSKGKWCDVLSFFRDRMNGFEKGDKRVKGVGEGK